jgi:hypothetical protein
LILTEVRSLSCGYRKQGAVSARHYHKGLSVGKNPEKSSYFQGEITINWFDVRNRRRKGTEKVAPSMLTVYPFAWHEVIADTDIVIFGIKYIGRRKTDTFQLEEKK